MDEQEDESPGTVPNLRNCRLSGSNSQGQELQRLRWTEQQWKEKGSSALFLLIVLMACNL